jgi:hypothetical protein
MGSVGVKSPREILAAGGELIDTEIDRRQPPGSIHRYPAGGEDKETPASRPLRLIGRAIRRSGQPEKPRYRACGTVPRQQLSVRVCGRLATVIRRFMTSCYLTPISDLVRRRGDCSDKPGAAVRPIDVSMLATLPRNRLTPAAHARAPAQARFAQMVID